MHDGARGTGSAQRHRGTKAMQPFPRAEATRKRRCPPSSAAGAGGRRPSARCGWPAMVAVAGWHKWLSAKSASLIGWSRSFLGVSSMAPIPRHPPAASPVQCVPLLCGDPGRCSPSRPLSPSLVLTTPQPHPPRVSLAADRLCRGSDTEGRRLCMQHLPQRVLPTCMLATTLADWKRGPQWGSIQLHLPLPPLLVVGVNCDGTASHRQAAAAAAGVGSMNPPIHQGPHRPSVP
ncbi:hypothetical protein QBC39DRAFT_97505 [Podospora conica]|nr:hypothetical protein QBC39DRAFT_97505 [Schizothecium conicum]